jgi:signal transduction histidine kinase
VASPLGVYQARILIVDDQESNVDLLEAVLRRAGYSQMRALTDSRFVMTQMAEFAPDVILLDLMMPHIDGFQVLRQIQGQVGPTGFLPVVVLTADVSPEAKQQALVMGANDFLTKPFDPAEVALRVRNLLQTRLLYLELERQRRLLEEQNATIQEATTRKSAFLAGMSHEIRTPLNAIIGFTQLLWERKAGPLTPEQQEFLGDVLNSGKHLLALINDILDLAKVEAGKVEFYPEEIELPLVMREVIDGLQPLIEAKSVAIRQDIDPSVARVVIDRSRFKQVLYNYLSNAIKFTPEGGKIDIRAHADVDGLFRVEVADAGPGIPAEQIGMLFTEFRQLRGKGSPATGTGLGLALTKRIVEAQGGTVGVESAPGRGSTFYAVLPRAPLPR